MEVLHPRCCGLDVHKQTVVACVIAPKIKETRTFSTMTGDLIKLREWLLDYKVTHVAMESTGVYWKPICNVLEGANIKLSSVATDITGVSGRAMLEAMVSGVSDPKKLAEMARGRMRKKKGSLEEALSGLMGEHQKMMLISQLRHLDFLDGEIAQLDDEISRRMQPFDEVIERLDEIPGVDRRRAEEYMSEVGKGSKAFATGEKLASWIGLCPGNNESAGKRKGGRTRHGNRWLCSALVQAARGAARSKGNYLSAQYHRLAPRRGDKRAIVAVAHSISVIMHNMVVKGTTYQDLGQLYFDNRDREHVIQRAMKRIEALGYKVSLQVA